MPQGVQIFNPNGKIIFDLSDIAYVIYGQGDTGYQNGCIVDQNIKKTVSYLYIIESMDFLKILMLAKIITEWTSK